MYELNEYRTMFYVLSLCVHARIGSGLFGITSRRTMHINNRRVIIYYNISPDFMLSMLKYELKESISNRYNINLHILWKHFVAGNAQRTTLLVDVTRLKMFITLWQALRKKFVCLLMIRTCNHKKTWPCIIMQNSLNIEYRGVFATHR